MQGYARAVLAGAGLFGTDEIDQQVAARIDRQGVLTRDRPPLLSGASPAEDPGTR